MKIPSFDAVELGEAWRLSKNSQGVAVPILVIDPSRKRGYKLLDEVKDKVELKDTGNISGLHVNNKSDSFVFIRKGTMLTGGTQHRAVQVSLVAAPSSVTEAPIRCIFASKGIQGGATMTAMPQSYVPRNVEKKLRSGQSETWDAVTAYSLSSSHVSANYLGSNNITTSHWMDATRSDNLTDVVGKSTKVIDEAMKDVPADHVRQIGLIVVGAKGVEGIEMFDHPDSWNALSKGVIRNYAEILTNVIPDIFDINMDRVKEAVFAFLTRLQNVEGTEAFSNSDSKTFEFQTEEIEGEFTVLEEGLIHVLANAVDKGIKTTNTAPHSEGWLFPTPRTLNIVDNTWTPSVDGAWVNDDKSDNFTISSKQISDDKEFVNRSNVVTFLTKKRGFETLAFLADGPSTFTEIQTRTQMSSKTVDQGLKEASELGLVEKMVRMDGATAYKLTNSGARANPKKFKKSFQ